MRALSVTQNFGALVAMLSVLSAVVDYLFRSHYAQASAEEMNRIFGAYNAHAGVIALIFQIFLTRMLLSRIGLFPFYFSFPQRQELPVFGR